MLPIAHAGHWAANLAYAMPVFVLVGWLGVAKLKDRRSGRRVTEPLEAEAPDRRA